MSDENAEAAANITKDVEPNYLDPNFILQNLAICSAEKLYDQPPFTIRAKQRLAEIVSLQAVFYTMLCLKSFIGCDMPPSIVIIGTGTIGTAIIDLLTKCGCQPYMYIYSRSDVAAKQWRDRGYKSHHIISRLLRGVNADIFIFAFNLQSFPSVCRQIIDVVTPQSACINTIFGLNRKRIFRVLRIPTVFRTYVEAAVIARRLECELKDLVDDARAHVAVGGVKSVVKEFFAEGGVLADLGSKRKSPSTVPTDRHSEHSDDEDSSFHMDLDYDSDSEYVELERELKLSAVEEACQLVARRSDGNIVHQITLLEYFNSVRGMPHPLARREAIESVLGDVMDEDREPVFVLNPHIVPVASKDEDGSRPGTGKSRPCSRGGAAAAGKGGKPGTGNPFGAKRLSGVGSSLSPVSSSTGRRNTGKINAQGSGSGATGTSPRPIVSPPRIAASASRKDFLKNATKSTNSSRKDVTMNAVVNSFPVNKSSPLLNLHFPLTECILLMRRRVGVHFQEYFSRYILIKDIPPPIKEHPISDTCAHVPEWPPEPVYFNNILDIYADRRKKNIPLYEEDYVVSLYGTDTLAANPSSRGGDMLKQLDEDSDNDNRELKEMQAPSLVEREAREKEYKEIEDFINGVSPEPSPRTAELRAIEVEEKAREDERVRLTDEANYLKDQKERNQYALNLAKDIINREDRGSPEPEIVGEVVHED